MKHTNHVILNEDLCNKNNNNIERTAIEENTGGDHTWTTVESQLRAHQ